MATARISATGLPIPQGGIGDILEGGTYRGPPRVFAGGAGGSGSNILKGIINLINKDDDDIIEVKDEDLIREEKKDVSTGGEDPDKDPDEKTIIFDDPQTTARKLTQQGIDALIDKSIKKLKDKYKEIGKEKEFELYEEDPSNLDRSLKGDIAKQIYEDNLATRSFTSPKRGVTSILDIISEAIDVNSPITAKKLLSEAGVKFEGQGPVGKEVNRINVQKQVDLKRERYKEYIPTIVKIFNENPDLPLFSQDPNKKTVTSLIQEEIGPTTKAGGLINKDTISSILESSGLREKKLGAVPIETKEKIIKYLLEDDNYKTMSSNQVIKNLNLDIAKSTLAELRRNGFPGVSVEGYENQKLVPDSKSRTALAKARSLFDAMIKSDYPDISREEANRLRVTFSDYISDAFDVGRKEGFTKKQIAEAYSYVTQERMFPSLEEEFYQKFFAELRAENEKTFDLINQVRQFEGQKPLGGFQEFMKEYPQLFLTMGHTGRDTPKEGKMAGFDLRNVEYQTLADNQFAKQKYPALLTAWGDDEDPDNLDEFLKIANEFVERGIRQVFTIPKSGQTIIIGRQEPKPFPSEEEFFGFGERKEIDFKKDGGIMSIEEMTRPLNAQR
jgi:hypothetical protein